MASSFGGTIKLTGESEYQKSLKAISENLKVLSSEMRVVTSRYDVNDRSTSNLSQQNEILTKKIDEQKHKVEVLTKALNDAKTQTDDNSSTTKKWETKLNDAQAELNKLERTLDSNEQEMKNYGKATDDAGEKSSRLGDIIKGNLISEGIINGFKALGSAMKTVGSSLVDVGKKALDSYANYEQLVGGVETLFALSDNEIKAYANVYGMSVDEVKSNNEIMKSSMNEVLGYANEAYKTAGLSANDYMETVTSFSAALLQSLGGDSFTASEKANQAIIDMSDNANKMGTDMSMIQSAYQGFAKGNYTMLDNLKLGYGGTKTEMERLLKDAQKISGVKYDLSSFADITEAIHVMQENMGIAGTTSNEASTTISGSLSSMKSAWSNLLTGIADDNTNFQGLIDNLVDSVVTVGDNIMPRVEIIIDGIVKLIMSLSNRLVDYMPKLLETGMSLMQTILDGFMSMLPELIPIAVQLINSLSSFILQNLPTILQAGITLLLELIKGISQALPELIPVAVRCIMDLVDTLLDNIDEIIECGIELLVALTDGIFNALPELISRLPEIIVKISAKLIELTPELLSCVLRLMISLATGMVKYSVEMVTRIPQIIKLVVNAFNQHLKDMVSIGKNMVSGIWQGISGSIDWIKNKIKGWVGDVTKYIKKLFGINSPSRLFKDEIGTNLALGLGEGFGDTMKDVSRDMANSIPTEFDANINTNYSTSANNVSNNYDTYLQAFKDALKGVKVVMNNKEMGNFIIDTVETAVYS
jgi:phage-related protein